MESSQVKTALVLSGGGSKGAFQLGALEALTEAGWTFDCVAGVSVGALNGAMVAAHQLERLGEIWRTIERRDVYRGTWPWVLFRAIAGRKGLFDNSPLLELIRDEVDPDGIDIPLEIGVVQMESGRYFTVDPSSLHFKRLLFASTTIPIVWPPHELGNELFVDGGVRNITPLGDVIQYDPRRIVIITTEPRDKPPATRSPSNIVDVAQRTLDIILDETFQNDIRTFLRINDLVRQAGEEDVVLRRPSGEPYVAYEHLIIEPEEPLGSGLDFERDQLDAWIAAGRAAAEEAVDQTNLLA